MYIVYWLDKEGRKEKRYISCILDMIWSGKDCKKACIDECAIVVEKGGNAFMPGTLLAHLGASIKCPSAPGATQC
jgi:hypothetical protein